MLPTGRKSLRAGPTRSSQSRGRPLRRAWDFSGQDGGRQDPGSSKSEGLDGERSWPPVDPQGPEEHSQCQYPDDVSGGGNGMMRFRLAGSGGRRRAQWEEKGPCHGELEGQGDRMTLDSKHGAGSHERERPSSADSGSRRHSEQLSPKSTYRRTRKVQRR